ncbi:MAG: RluA family pseudouridine synthase [Bacteroidaceae bacterium]|nr:RluA family pseudouridine synthase [Bacteroidaceae bacterium]
MRQTKRYGKKGPNNIFEYSPIQETTLLPFLFEVLAPKSRTDIKSMLAHHHVKLNGTVITQFDTPVKPEDVVSINFTRPFAFVKDGRLHIIYEDEWLIVVEKASGLLSVGREGSDEKTAWSILTNYMKQKDPRAGAFVCHRLDQYTSGILVFAKDGNVQRELRYQWDRYVRERCYLAVVEGCPENERDELRHYLTEDSKMNVRVANIKNSAEGNAPQGGRVEPKLAVTRYSVEQTNGKYSLLNVQIFTGRKNQIRVQLSEIGYPVAGDRKYGAKTNPCGRLMLHNSRLSIEHPVTHEILTFNLPAPKSFYSTSHPQNAK